jgi:hypothetical protein
MKPVLALTCAVLVPVAARAQPSPPLRHLVGRSISGHMEIDARAQTTADTATLTFAAPDGGPTLTVDFLSRYELQAGGAGIVARTPPKVVDIVVSQHPVDEEKPEATLRANGEPVPLVTRFRSARAVVSTITFDQFVSLANAATLVERAFDCELEFTPQQLRMLKSTAERWTGR